MSDQQPESSSESGLRESEGSSSFVGSKRKMLITLIVTVVILGSPWWVTAIPQFGFTN